MADFTLIHGKQLRDFRVTKGTGLTVGIASGNYSIGGNDGYYAGVSNQAVVDNATNYVQIDDTGTIDVNQTGFDSLMLPLATVVTLSGAITTITDKRPVFSKGGSGGGGTTQWKQGVPTGSINSSNTVFTLPDTPDTLSLLLILDGNVLDPGAGDDYTLSGATITFTTAPSTGSKLVYFYTLTASYSGSGTSLAPNEITGTSASMATGNAYVTNNASTVNLLLPSVAAFGDIVAVVGKGAGGWLVSQNSGQIIKFGNTNSTSGVGGSIASTDAGDVVFLMCITANTEFRVIQSIGLITVV